MLRSLKIPSVEEAFEEYRRMPHGFLEEKSQREA
jgi:hypothetical protein